jgi:hypothetical protein
VSTKPSQWLQDTRTSSCSAALIPAVPSATGRVETRSSAGPRQVKNPLSTYVSLSLSFFPFLFRLFVVVVVFCEKRVVYSYCVLSAAQCR